MYDFIDVIETSEGASLPSEALKINGEFIEDLIEGYRTLSVVGREALSPELDFYETGIRDGSTLKGKRYPARMIRITYQLIAATNEEFRAAYNKLAHILDVTDAQLIFNDEQDKYFTGTPALIGEVEPGRNAVVGEFEILCLDPFKYSIMEYEAEPVLASNSVLIDYAGTYKSFPKLEAHFYKEEEASEDGETVTALTGEGDCGYVAFFTENEKIIQLGDPDEADGEAGAYAASQTLINADFNKLAAWGSAAKSQWAVSGGQLTGTVSKWSTPTTPAPTKALLLRALVETEAPDIYYEVHGTAWRTSQESVKVTVTIKANLNNKESYFLRGFILDAAVYIDGDWRTVRLKNTNDQWRGTTVHSKSFTTTITGISAGATSLSGIQFKAFRSDNTGGETGVLPASNCANMPISLFPSREPEEWYLYPSSYGSGSQWHGVSMTRAIPADASGEVGAVNCTVTYAQKMCASSINQLGEFQVLLNNGTQMIASALVQKSLAGNNALLRLYVNGKLKESITVDLSQAAAKFTSAKTSTITKFGKKVTFNICGISRTYQDAGIENTAVAAITFKFNQYGTKPALAYNGLHWAKFVKNNCNTWREIKNKFSTNDVIVADCKDGEIFLNGVLAPAYGALGNDWEEFYLTPGLNQIGVAFSEWVDEAHAPKFLVKYREVFL